MRDGVSRRRPAGGSATGGGAAATIAGVTLFAVLIALYTWAIAGQAVALLGTGTPTGIALGAGFLLLPALGVAGVLVELRFGLRSARLARRLEAEGGLPEVVVPLLPSGRPDRTAAGVEFDRFRAETEAAPEDWRSWFRLGIAYDAAGDRGRARRAVREAIRLERRSR